MELPCEHCLTGHVLPGEPKGSFKDNAYYISGVPEGATKSDSTARSDKRAIVLLTDAFGLALKNPKILADDFARHLKCEVFVPDLFNGEWVRFGPALGPLSIRRRLWAEQAMLGRIDVNCDCSQ
jgi:hypothetical protein